MIPTFEAKTKKWGNSIGIVIPKEIIESENISIDQPLQIGIFRNTAGILKDEFGSFDFNGKSTDEIMAEIDRDANEREFSM